MARQAVPSCSAVEFDSGRADAQGITNFEIKVCSADDLPFGDATFDSISVRFGYMFFPDVAKARTYEHDGKVRIPGMARCIIGTK